MLFGLANGEIVIFGGKAFYTAETTPAIEEI